MRQKPSTVLTRPQPGCFREPGTFHIHVDSRRNTLLDRVFHYLAAAKLPSKLNVVIDSVNGSLFTDDAHTAKGDGQERFFSIAASDRGHAVGILKGLLELLQSDDNIAIEAEQVLGHMRSEKDTKWKDARDPLRPWLDGGIYGSEVGFDNAESKRVEIHHCFDLFKESGTPPWRLEDMSLALDEEKLPVRTWSLFDRPKVWSFRSTVFVDEISFAERCKEDYALLRHYISRTGLKLRDVWIVVEEILGIWTPPLSRTDTTRSANRVLLVSSDTPPLTHGLSELVDKCQTSETSNATPSEADASTIYEIHTAVSAFEKALKSSGLEPILIEFAINDDLPTHNRKPSADKAFAAHIATYADTQPPASRLIEAWQEAIRAIVGNNRLQIDPIVSHWQTYESFFLYDKLHPRVSRAYLANFSETISRTGDPVEVAIGSSTYGQDVSFAPAACRKVYPYNTERTPAPVDNTVRTLSQSFVSCLMARVRSSGTLEAERKALLRVLNDLLAGYLLIVPFSWPVQARPSVGASTEKPGGCVFTVVVPANPAAPIGMQQLADAAARVRAIVLRAALVEAHEGEVDRTEPSVEIMVGALTATEELRRALKGIRTIDYSERLEHVIKHAPSLVGDGERHRSALAILRRELQDDEFNVEDLVWAVMKAGFNLTKSKHYDWSKRAEESGMWRRPRKRQKTRSAT